MKEPSDPRRENAFVMLGTIHGDRDGAAILYSWLKSALPDMVTLEFSQYGVNYRRGRGEALKARVRATVDELRTEGRPIDDAALDALFSYIDLPWEFTVASQYCQGRGAPLFLVDMDRFSAMNLGRMDELVAKENLGTLLLGSDRRTVTHQKALARLFFEKGVETVPYTEEMRERDRHMSGTISRLMTRRDPSNLVHICGWQHLCDPFDLYTTLRPQKVFIYDKALCV
ncbi:MAG: hypothetical protein ABSC19_02730 [Syntrophorhabdales bacterium]|jgi:hypothetical protein